MDCTTCMRLKRWDLSFLAEPEEAAALRRALRDRLGAWGLHEVTDAAQLCVSELVSNVINHVGSGIPVTLCISTHGTCLRVEVRDPDTRALPTLAEACTAVRAHRGNAVAGDVVRQLQLGAHLALGVGDEGRGEQRERVEGRALGDDGLRSTGGRAGACRGGWERAHWGWGLVASVNLCGGPPGQADLGGQRENGTHRWREARRTAGCEPCPTNQAGSRARPRRHVGWAQSSLRPLGAAVAWRKVWARR